MDIHHSLIKDFVMPKVKSVFVIDYYDGIQGALAGRDDFSYKELFANPRHRTQTDIIWASEYFKNRPVLLSDLYEYEKEKYSYMLNLRIHSVEVLIENLKKEGDGAPLSELLSKSISCIDEKSVYCSDDKIVIVNWGLIPRHQDYLNSMIYRSGKFVGNWDKIHLFIPEADSNDANDIYKNATTTIINDLESESVSIATSQMANEERFNDDGVNLEKKLIHVATVVKPEVTIDTLKKQTSGSVALDEENNLSITNKEELVETASLIDKIHKFDSNKYKTDSEKYDWKTFLTNVWIGIKFLIRKLLCLLLLLILFFAAMYLCKGCQGPIHKINPFYNPLPDNPVVLPIDDACTGKNRGGMSLIATDRLNILLEQKDDNTMFEWAKAFKDVYSGEEYEVVYYNKELDLLQIRVPLSEREQIKSDLPSQITDFLFEVFDETIQGSEIVLNDPALNDANNSWYLTPIGAKDAWDVTIGESDIIIAVVDNGFDMNHPELSGKIYRPYNVLSQNTNLRPIITNEGVDAHGTHVAATAAGNCNNGNGLLGIAPNCKLMLVQVGSNNANGSMSNIAIMEGVIYAIKQGADVVNISLGMYLPDEIKKMNEGQQLNYITSSFSQEEYMWNKIFAMAQKNNCTIVFAAGNDNTVAGIDPKKRNKNTIRVSAIDKNLSKADFSNYGVYPNLNREYSTLSAPGVSIYSAVPDGQYKMMQGTSMAAPVVSGAVALLKSIDRNLTTNQIIAILKKTGQKVDNTIGSMINIGKAIHLLKDDAIVNNDCDKIKREIERLEARIDSLTRLCPDAATPADTLKYDDAVKNEQGLDGIWKTTTELVSTSDQTPVELYMSFDKLEGTLTIINKGVKYLAPLTAQIVSGKISITQHSFAQNGDKSFLPYEYVCAADRRGHLLCTAISTQNKIIFNLIRIKQIEN